MTSERVTQRTSDQEAGKDCQGRRLDFWGGRENEEIKKVWEKGVLNLKTSPLCCTRNKLRIPTSISICSEIYGLSVRNLKVCSEEDHHQTFSLPLPPKVLVGVADWYNLRLEVKFLHLFKKITLHAFYFMKQNSYSDITQFNLLQYSPAIFHWLEQSWKKGRRWVEYLVRLHEVWAYISCIKPSQVQNS